MGGWGVWQVRQLQAASTEQLSDVPAHVRQRAAQLVDQFGLVPGDAVALLMKNSCDYLEVLYAVWWLGGVVVPINAKLHPAEAAWIATNAEARLIFTDGGRVFASSRDLPARCKELDAHTLPPTRGWPKPWSASPIRAPRISTTAKPQTCCAH